MLRPTLLIVTDYSGLFAYLLLPDGVAEILKRIEFQCDCQTNVPMIDWTPGAQGYRMLGREISRIIQRYRPDSWGLACPAGMLEPLLDRLSPTVIRTLAVRKELDVSGITIANVAGAFGLCPGPALTEPEHA